jgi:hypothetical protein
MLPVSILIETHKTTEPSFRLFARIRPRPMFVVGALLHALRLSTPLQMVIDPSIRAGAGIIFASTGTCSEMGHEGNGCGEACKSLRDLGIGRDSESKKTVETKIIFLDTLSSRHCCLQTWTRMAYKITVSTQQGVIDGENFSVADLLPS